MTEVGLALAASVTMHVTWNLIARHQPSTAYPLWWVLLAHLLLIAPWGFHALVTQVCWDRSLVALLVLSAGANTAYFLGLHQAYQHAPVALVYPLVRSSPLLIALWGVLWFDQPLAPAAWTGIAVSVAGLWLMAASPAGGTDRRALPWALLAMLATSAYSLSDQVATARIYSFAGIIGFLSVGYLAAWLGLTLQLRRRSGAWRPLQSIHPLALVIGGLCIGTAYALVIHALRFLPAAEVVAYTNAGIVLASLVSIFVFHERHDARRRLLGALIISAGLAWMALART